TLVSNFTHAVPQGSGGSETHDSQFSQILIAKFLLSQNIKNWFERRWRRRATVGIEVAEKYRKKTPRPIAGADEEPIDASARLRRHDVAGFRKHHLSPEAAEQAFTPVFTGHDGVTGEEGHQGFSVNAGEKAHGSRKALNASELGVTQ